MNMIPRPLPTLLLALAALGAPAFAPAPLCADDVTPPVITITWPADGAIVGR